MRRKSKRDPRRRSAFRLTAVVDGCERGVTKYPLSKKDKDGAQAANEVIVNER